MHREVRETKGNWQSIYEKKDCALVVMRREGGGWEREKAWFRSGEGDVQVVKYVLLCIKRKKETQVHDQEKWQAVFVRKRKMDISENSPLSLAADRHVIKQIVRERGVGEQCVYMWYEGEKKWHSKNAPQGRRPCSTGEKIIAKEKSERTN